MMVAVSQGHKSRTTCNRILAQCLDKPRINSKKNSKNKRLELHVVINGQIQGGTWAVVKISSASIEASIKLR